MLIQMHGVALDRAKLFAELSQTKPENVEVSKVVVEPRNLTIYGITRHVRTNVSVLNGGTVVLGGVFEDEKLESVTKVLLLGDLPLLGHLFKSTKKTNVERELLIFITPVILGKS